MFKLSLYLQERKYLALGIIGAFILYMLFLLSPALMGSLGGTFKSKNVPIEYVNLENYLKTDNSFHRTLWVPNAVLFGHYTPINPSISARDFFREYDSDKLLKKINKPSSEKILSDSSVKYVIIPQDSEKEIYLTERKYDEKKYKKVVSDLDKIPWLTKTASFGKVIVYKTKNFKDHFWCACQAKISYRMINPTKYKVSIDNASPGDTLIFSESYDSKWIAQNSSFKSSSKPFDKLNSFDLAGNGDLEIVYAPQELVNRGVAISLFTLIIILLILGTNLVLKQKNGKIQA